MGALALSALASASVAGTYPGHPPTEPMNPTRITHGQSHTAVEAFAMTYTPKAVRWVEPPPEVTHVTVWEPLTLANGGGTLATYRRDTNFAGNLSEAVKVIEFASHGFTF